MAVMRAPAGSGIVVSGFYRIAGGAVTTHTTKKEIPDPGAVLVLMPYFRKAVWLHCGKGGERCALYRCYQAQSIAEIRKTSTQSVPQKATLEAFTRMSRTNENNNSQPIHDVSENLVKYIIVQTIEKQAQKEERLTQ